MSAASSRFLGAGIFPRHFSANSLFPFRATASGIRRADSSWYQKRVVPAQSAMSSAARSRWHGATGSATAGDHPATLQHIRCRETAGG